MTSVRPTAPLHVDSVEAAEAALRERGLRVSATRRLVLESLFMADTPLVAEEIARGVPDRIPQMDLPSVYRNLELLEEVGLVRHVHLGHGAGRYALARDAGREYLVCEACGAVTALAPCELDDVPRSFGSNTDSRRCSTTSRSSGSAHRARPRARRRHDGPT